MYRIDNWINEGSTYIIEEIYNQYLNVSSYSPLIGNTFTELPNELKYSKKGLINIQNDDFPVSKKDYSKMELQNKIGINVFCYVKTVIYPTYQIKVIAYFLLLISNNFVSNYVYIKDFNRFMFNKTKYNGKNTFVKVVYSVLVVKIC